MTTQAAPATFLINTVDFQNKIGSVDAAIQTVANAQGGAGTTFTDSFNFALEASLGTTAPVYDINQTGRTFNHKRSSCI